MSRESLTIGELSRRAGVNVTTIRYYESVGVLPRPSRAGNNYRRYDRADVNRLLLLQRIRLLGVPLVHTKHLLAGATDARCADVQQALLALVTDRVRALDQEIAALYQLRAEVESVQRSLTGCSPDARESFSECHDRRCIALTGEEETHGDAGSA